MDLPAWYYDETRHSGVDYGNPDQVAVYDQRHRRFREYRKDALAVAERLNLKSGQTVIDMGSGTGAFALNAAPLCKTVYAVDVSQPMLEYFRRKADEMGIRNIQFCRGGFLTY